MKLKIKKFSKIVTDKQKTRTVRGIVSKVKIKKDSTVEVYYR